MNALRFAGRCCPIFVACALGAVTAGAAPPAGNAALEYWKAVALLREPRTAEQLTYAEYVENTLPGLQPAIFNARPAVYRWVLSDLPSLQAVIRADRIGECDFQLRQPGRPEAELNHLPRLRQLCRRIGGLNLALEFAGRPAEAAAGYAGLLNLLCRLDQDATLASNLAAADLMQDVLSALEGFISRAPGPEALDILLNAARRRTKPLISPGRALRRESAWLSKELARAPDLMAFLQRWRGRDRLGEMMDAYLQAQGLTDARAKKWLAEYRAAAGELADALEQPFAQGWPILQRLDAERDRQRNEPEIGTNPLPLLLLPSGAELYERMFLANAQADLAALLCAAASAREKDGRWPADLEAAAKVLERPAPLDPFSGQPMTYQVARGRLTMGVRIPRRMEERGTWLYTISPESRFRADEQRTREAIGRARVIEATELFEPVGR